MLDNLYKEIAQVLKWKFLAYVSTALRWPISNTCMYTYSGCVYYYITAYNYVPSVTVCMCVPLGDHWVILWYYCIARKFGEELNLAVWQSTAKLNSANISYSHIYVCCYRTELPNVNPPTFLQRWYGVQPPNLIPINISIFLVWCVYPWVTHG